MTSYCYRTGTRTDTSVSTTFRRSTSFLTSTFTAAPTGTQVTGRVSTTRIPSVVSFPTEVTYRSTYYSTSCTTYRTTSYSRTYPYFGYSTFRLSSTLIAIIVMAGLWFLAFLAVGIYLLFFREAVRRRKQQKGQGGFNHNQYPNPQSQQYTPVPQDPLYSRESTQYPPPSSLYGGQQQNPNPGPQNLGYQPYNTPNFGAQGTNQWQQNPGTPSASSFTSGPGPGYIPPGAAQPLSHPTGMASYSMSSTTPSPPPGPHGPGSDPHRLLYTQQNDLSAAVSLAHQSHEQPALSSSYPMSGQYQQSHGQQQQQPALSSYPMSGHPYQQSHEQQQQPSYPTTASGPPFAQLQQTPSQAQLAAQYRGYAEPATLNQYGRA